MGYQTVNRILHKWRARGCEFRPENTSVRGVNRKLTPEQEGELCSRDMLVRMATRSLVERAAAHRDQGYNISKDLLRSIYLRNGIKFRKVSLCNVNKARKAEQIREMQYRHCEYLIRVHEKEKVCWWMDETTIHCWLH